MGYSPYSSDERAAYFKGVSYHLLDSFCDMLETVPPKAVIPAADAERKMVEEDLATKRTAADEEAMSVLQFCHYLVNAERGLQSSLPSWPIEHFASYRKVVQRLVEAGELPWQVKEQFDFGFSRVLLKALTSPN